MKIVASAGREDIAVVYVGRLEGGKMVEFVEALQPPMPREEKWVLQVSTLYGCPAGCLMCDAGGYYQGKILKNDIFAQVDFMVRRRFPNGIIPSRQLKIQFARVGEPSLNGEVLEVLEELPARYDAPGLMPSISTIAPARTEQFFERLRELKSDKYRGGRFQLQFSIHTTDERIRDRIIPVRKWSFEQVAEYGETFCDVGDRKIALNFALAVGNPIDADILRKRFHPGKFLIKLTPLNPTYRAREHGLVSSFDGRRGGESSEVVESLKAVGYQVIVSIGEAEENYIGSNCGQFLRRHMEAAETLRDGYTYPICEYPADVLLSPHPVLRGNTRQRHEDKPTHGQVG